MAKVDDNAVPSASHCAFDKNAKQVIARVNKVFFIFFRICLNDRYKSSFCNGITLQPQIEQDAVKTRWVGKSCAIKRM
jgi:hypothetical protein